MLKKVFSVLVVLIVFQNVSFAKDSITWVFTDYPPANYQTESGEFKGFLYDITIEAFEKRLGIPVEVSIFPWKRCQYLVQQGEYDMFLTIPTPQRLEYALTTEEAVWVKRRIIYTYAGHPKSEEIQTLRGLEEIKEKGFTVLSYLGNGWVEAAVEGAGIPVEYASQVENMYKMLAGKRADIIIEEPSIALPNIEKLGLNSKILSTEGIGAESGFHLLIGKKSQHVDVLEQLNTVIKEMWQDGTIEKILAEYGM